MPGSQLDSFTHMDCDAKSVAIKTEGSTLCIRNADRAEWPKNGLNEKKKTA